MEGTKKDANLISKDKNYSAWDENILDRINEKVDIAGKNSEFEDWRQSNKWIYSNKSKMTHRKNN